jgi:hypothetical protein
MGAVDKRIINSVFLVLHVLQAFLTDSDIRADPGDRPGGVTAGPDFKSSFNLFVNFLGFYTINGSGPGL